MKCSQYIVQVIVSIYKQYTCMSLSHDEYDTNKMLIYLMTKRDLKCY